MSSCSTYSSKNAPCPVNGRIYKQVNRKTVLHQLSCPWDKTIKEQTYYYCDDPECDVVYFGEDNTIFTCSDMRLDEQSRNTTICYCFDVSVKDLASNKEQCKTFVVEQTKQSTCDCEIRNPSGRCCLKNFH